MRRRSCDCGDCGGKNGKLNRLGNAVTKKEQEYLIFVRNMHRKRANVPDESRKSRLWKSEV
jgi:hypothetical protein